MVRPGGRYGRMDASVASELAGLGNLSAEERRQFADLVRRIRPAEDQIVGTSTWRPKTPPRVPMISPRVA